MSRVVRQSKFRHVFGEAEKKENCYDGITLSRNAWDSNYISTNLSYFAVCWEAAGGGSFAVVPWTAKGKLPNDFPLVSGHKAPVLDVACNPFTDALVASASEDGTAKLWSIPAGGLTETMRDPVQTLTGHRRKVGTVEWHPVANNVLATSSTDYTVKIWDVEKGVAANTVEGHGNIVQSTNWNYDGSLLSTSCKDKKVRIFDPRSGAIAHEVSAHDGVKGSRVCWAGTSGFLITAGFSKTSDRQYYVWDPRNFEQPIQKEDVDTASGLLMPFYDADTNILFLAGKGDGNIRYFELDGGKFYFLSQYQSNVPARGVAVIPKLAVEVGKCEIVRMAKMTPSSCEIISFKVPRKGGEEVFQDDIFPPTANGEPVLTADEWFSGKNASPKLVSLEGGFHAKERASISFNPEVKTEDEGPQSEKELREEWKKLKNRVAYLESEITKRDAKIKELGGH